MTAKFPTFKPSKAPPKDFAALYYELDKDEKFDEHPRSYQADAWRRFQELREEHADVAVCLPTGTGKTMVGLMTGHFDQRTKPTRVLYLTPNKHLANQVLQEAEALGVPAVDLRSTWNSIPQTERNDYTGGKAIGVASFWTLYNSNPRPETPQLLIFDDVHAAADAALGRWRIEVDREVTPHLHETISAYLRQVVAPTLKARLGPKPPPEAQLPLMVPQREWLQVVDSIGDALDQFVDEPEANQPGGAIRFPLSVVRHKLARMFCFVAPGRIVIRPWLPPSMEIPQFRGAETRLYLSATIDRWGNMQQVVGVEQVERIDDLTAPIQGQRVVVDMNLVESTGDPINQTAYVMGRVPKALVLATSKNQRSQIIEKLQEQDYAHEIWGEDPESEVDFFRQAASGALILAGRYDGLDLGHGACQHIILAGLPDAIGEKELFVSKALEIVTLDAARARQRIQQAMGRCTRVKDDTAAIWLAGSRLSEFLRRPEILGAFPQQLRLEIVGSNQVRDFDQAWQLATECISSSDDWRNYYRESLEAATATEPEPEQIDGDVLEFQKLDSRFNSRLYDGRFEDAREIAEAIASKLASGGHPKEAAAWQYMAAAAADTGQWEHEADPYSPWGDKHIEAAIQGAAGRTWMEHLARTQKPEEPSSSASSQAKRILAFMRGNAGRVSAQVEHCLALLKSANDNETRNGLGLLGRMLGYDVRDDQLKGAPDSVWHVAGEARWIWEAKTDKKEGGAISLSDARQIAGQPEWVREHYGLSVLPEARVACLTPVSRIGNDARQEGKSFDVVSPDDLVASIEPWLRTLSALDRRLSEDDTIATRTLVSRRRIHRIEETRLSETLSLASGESALAVVEL